MSGIIVEFYRKYNRLPGNDFNSANDKVLSKTLDSAFDRTVPKPDKALDELKKKFGNYFNTFDWDDASSLAHSKAFTVAKSAVADILEDIYKELQKFREEGLTVKDFVENLQPSLEQKGWWGRKEVTDPRTGEKRPAARAHPSGQTP